MHDLSLYVLEMIENSLRAGAGKVAVRVWIEAPRDELSIVVEDDGPGLDVSVEQATDPFYTTKAGKRTGLGLPLFREAAEAAAQVPQPGSVYAGHNWHPAFLAGVSTLGYELAEQLGPGGAGGVVVPLGYGNLLLGLWDAFTALRRADPAVRVPRLFGVQSEAFSPVAAAWRAGASEVEAVRPGETMAEGIRCVRPVRDRRLLAAVRASGGAVVSVDEREIATALAELLARGVYVEPTSAVAWAGLTHLPPVDGECVVVLTGSGLKAPGAIERAVGLVRPTEHGQAGETDHDARHGAESQPGAGAGDGHHPADDRSPDRR